MTDLLLRAAIFAQSNLQPGEPAPGAPAAPAGAPAGDPAAAPQGGSMLQTLIFFGIMIAIFYLLIFRPQQKRAKEHKELVTSLKRGDTVITNSGIYGRIAQIDEHVVHLEVAKDTVIRVLKSHVAGRQSSTEEGGAQKDASLLSKTQ
ncbi:MAG: hypothetical protein AMXMBFR64_60320 [Myxococcales bacterium]